MTERDVPKTIIFSRSLFEMPEKARKTKNIQKGGRKVSKEKGNHLTSTRPAAPAARGRIGAQDAPVSSSSGHNPRVPVVLQHARVLLSYPCSSAVKTWV